MPCSACGDSTTKTLKKPVYRKPTYKTIFIQPNQFAAYRAYMASRQIHRKYQKMY